MMQWPEDQAVAEAIRMVSEREDITSVVGSSHRQTGSGADAAGQPFHF